MAAEEELVSRREFDKLEARVTAMDVNGTRGVIVVQERLIELSKKVARMDEQVEARFGLHDKLHETEKQERVTGRRWMIGTAIGVVVALVAMIGLLLNVIAHVH